MQKESSTHFGFDEIPASEKQGRVADVFDSVASKYDLMNNVLSFGVHHLWKRFTLELCGLRPGHQVLDLAGGTGDLAIKQASKVGESGQVYLADINAAMLQHGRDRVIDKGLVNRITAIQCNAEILPFADNSLDCITIAFGLRNVTDKEKALASMQRVLKPGGRLCVLEFSRPICEPLEKAYDFYSFKILPQLGEWITQDRDSYQYLAESIRMHPDQESLKQMMLDAGGFDEVEVHNLSGGIVALHRAFKY
ncbi:MAG: bifunctional demethylmenaquinone methyltransferase/2-methoxy-6-polyprenyl-1,4-benzoquinol methylase UbiE [Gammaproteobacteria bacterium]|nr:bifunctional demethylmenaquinone methyltransferase/2-methoxy-6-polyprenyl-1,4-benzoquinol methylase UbiE [Gammaproteobacteria bacterium]